MSSSIQSQLTKILQAFPEHLRRKSTQGTTISRWSSLSIAGRRASDNVEDIRGPLGLSLLHSPDEPQIDFVFVHGLRGGSRKTWSATESIRSFWPQEWLPLEPGFENVRIHSFGYNSDWGDGKVSQLTVHDFGQALLGEIMNSPTISGDDTNTAIVLVAHSMGGLVIKKALLQARQDATCQRLCSRMHSMFFLATPHRGSDSAHLLKSLLSLSSSKSYVNDLEKGSISTQFINDEFRNAYQDIHLWSFFETLPTTGLGMIVERESAVLGLPGERIQLMNTNHRNICKFADQLDPNYLSLRNAFKSTVESIKRDWISKQRNLAITQLQTISDFLGVLEGPEADLGRVKQKQTPGTCQWLTSSERFKDWSGFLDDVPLFWLEGEPATGKSTLAGHAIEHLCNTPRDCAYYFFKHGDSTRSSLVGALLSLAWQMARINTEIRTDIMLMADQGVFLDKTDESSVWRTLFQARILKLSWKEPWYWIFDALDECTNYASLLPLLAKLPKSLPLRILITSRPILSLDRAFQHESLPRVVETVAISNSLSDIELFLAKNCIYLPVENEIEREKLLTRILNRSKGNFLWTSLVLQELIETSSVQQAYEVLDSVPSGMEGLYSRILETITNHPRNNRLALAILKWCVCVRRPLTIEELKEALKHDLNDTFPRLEQTVSSITGNLVIIDSRSHVQLAHLTVRAYLLQDHAHAGNGNQFTIIKSRDHLSLAMICLNYLCGPELRVPRHRRGSTYSRGIKRSAFADYAAAHFSDHVLKTSAQDITLFNLLHSFFTTNVLAWVEMVALQKSLRPIITAARNLKSFLQKVSKYMAPLDQRVRELKSWANDLSYVVTSFGKPLLETPRSIYFVIPPICPSTSMIHRAAVDLGKGFCMYGLNEDDWDDRVACLIQPGKQVFAVASQNERLAIGAADGIVRIHDLSTMQQTNTFDHSEHVRYVAYSKTGALIATASRKSLKLWDTDENRLQWHQTLKDPIMHISFNKDASQLVVISRASEMLIWDIESSKLVSCVPLSDVDEATGEVMNTHRTPIGVQYSAEFEVLAVAYRQWPIVFWDLEEDPTNPIYIGSYNKDTESYYGPMNFALEFNPCVELIAASYDDGEIVVVNPFTQRAQASASEDSALLRASKDGEILASADGEGTITLFEFETLRKIYRIRSYPLNIRDLSFSSDSLQILEARGDHCNVWQPAALVRNTEFGDESKADVSEGFSEDYSHIPITLDARVYNDDKVITAAAVSGELVFCGREDGSLSLLAGTTGAELKTYQFHSRQVAIAIVCTSLSHRLFASVDRSGRILVLEIGNKGLGEPVMRLDRRSNEIVEQILISPDDQKLLVSMSHQDELWSLNSESSLVRNRFSDDSHWHWLLHPLQPQSLLLLEGSQLSSIDWNAFNQFENLSRFNIAEDVTDSSLLTTFVGSRGKSQICVMFAASKDGSTSAKLRIWDGLTTTTSSSSNRSGRITVTNYDRLAKEIKFAVGMNGTVFFFLTHSGWLCSLDTAGGRPRPSYSRHFFVPFRFHCNASALIMFITPTKDVILTHRTDLIIFSGGIDIEEQVPIDEKVSRGRPSMKATLGRNKSSPV